MKSDRQGVTGRIASGAALPHPLLFPPSGERGSGRECPRDTCRLPMDELSRPASAGSGVSSEERAPEGGSTS